MEIRPQFECHCSTCKEKTLKLEHKCPGCRRNIIVDINELELLSSCFFPTIIY